MKKFVKVITFLLICFVLLNCLSLVFMPKNNDKLSGMKYEFARGFYGENMKSIDVLAIGNSDLYSAFNPLQLWREQGIPSYVSAEPQQSIFGAYYMLKEVLTCQKPKLIILEVDELFSKSEALDVDDAIANALKYNFPLFEYHSRWKDLKANDFFDLSPYYKTRMEAKGYLYHNNVKPYKDGFDYMTKKNRSTNITYITKVYLDQFISLARKNNAEVLFVWFPSATSATSKRHDVVKDIANSYDIPFIDFNVNQYDTAFDWKTDSRDGGNHLNYYGAYKMTKYMGKYIKDNYSLPDQRENMHYQDWNQAYNDFIKKYNIEEIK